MSTFRTGYVALIGRPNAGKSTLLNKMLGAKLAITSSKPQTTRNRIMGIHTTDHMQAILVDTPGIHSGFTELNKSMVQIAHQVLEEVDVIALLVDMAELASRSKKGKEILDPELEAICKVVEASGKPVILLANKMDVVVKPLVLPVIECFSNRLSLHTSIPTSALTGDNVDAFEKELLALLPEGPALFPAEEWTQVTERFLVSEIVREKIFQLTKREIPYSTAVDVLTFDEADRVTKNIVRVHATIFVERDSQKGILIGKRGEMLKKIGTLARKELIGLLDCRVHLELFVKVEKDWSRSKRGLRRAGFQAG